MRYWLIGCGILLAILIAVVVFFGAYFVKELKKVEGEFDQVSVRYGALETAYPFDAYPGRNLTEEQAARFVDCRKDMMTPLEAWRDQLRDQDISTFTKITSGLGNISTLGQAHVTALEERKMSPSEYVWIMNFVLCALNAAEGRDATPALKALRSAFDRAATDQQLHDQAGSGTQPGLNFSERDPGHLLPSVDPTFLALPQQSLQAVEKNAEGLVDTMPVFFFFDNTFKEIIRTILQSPPGVYQRGGEEQNPSEDPGNQDKRSDEENR